MKKRKIVRAFAIVLIILAVCLEGFYHLKFESVEDRAAKQETSTEADSNKTKNSDTNQSNTNKAKKSRTSKHTKKDKSSQKKEQQRKTKEETKTDSDKSKENNTDLKDENLENSNQNVTSEQTTNISCSIQIVCNTITDTSKVTNDAIKPYIPSNGVILSKTSVEMPVGSSVYDVLQKATSQNGIQLEASYTSLYNSYYVEGISYIYEFDAGDLSGWMYQVNGAFPNYGCSAYKVIQGDNIVFCYTCDLGKDVGGSNIN